MTAPAPAVPRPTPLRDAAADATLAIGPIGALVTALLGFGLISVLQANAVTGLLGLIPGIVTGVVAALTASTTAAKGEPLVTPVSNPMNNAGQRLVPEVAPPVAVAPLGQLGLDPRNRLS